MSEDKQDKIIKLLSQITKQNQTEINHQKHLINNQVGLSSVIMNAQSAIVKGLNGVMQCVNGLSAHKSATNQPANENSNEFSDLSKITDRLDDITQSINRNHSAVTQGLKKNGDRITAQSVRDAKAILSQLNTNGRHVYDDFALLNVISRVLPDLLYLGSDIYAATNSVARKQGAMFYTNFANPGGYRQEASDFNNTLNNNEYYTNNNDDDN